VFGSGLQHGHKILGEDLQNDCEGEGSAHIQSAGKTESKDDEIHT
jgi:hypothetical protein